MDLYMITQKDLLRLLEDSITLRMLEQDGVDNWEWYGESSSSVLREYEEIYSLENNKLEDFSECAYLELDNYQKIRVDLIEGKIKNG